MRPDLSAYITFHGQAREALEYYRSALGGQLTLETYGRWGIPVAPGHEDDVVYGVLRTEDGFVLRAKDHEFTGDPAGAAAGFTTDTTWALCLNGEDEQRLRACWEGLARRATIVEPLRKSAWDDLNGELIDPFGIRWVVNIGASE